MFKALGLFMHLFNWVIEYLIKKCLNEPVVTNYFQRSFLSRGG